MIVTEARASQCVLRFKLHLPQAAGLSEISSVAVLMLHSMRDLSYECTSGMKEKR